MCFAICWQCWRKAKIICNSFQFFPFNSRKIAGKNYEKCPRDICMCVLMCVLMCVCVCWFFECFSFLIFGPRWQSEIRLLFYGLINAPRSGTFALASFAVNWNWNKLFILIYVCCALCVCRVWGDRCADSRLCIIFLRGDFLFIATGIKSELFISAHT